MFRVGGIIEFAQTLSPCMVPASMVLRRFAWEIVWRFLSWRCCTEPVFYPTLLAQSWLGPCANNSPNQLPLWDCPLYLQLSIVIIQMDIGGFKILPRFEGLARIYMIVLICDQGCINRTKRPEVIEGCGSCSQLRETSITSSFYLARWAAVNKLLIEGQEALFKEWDF